MATDKRTLATFEILQSEIEEDRRRNILEHQQAVRVSGIRRRKRGTGPLNILAEGDSWFRYPFYAETITQLKTMGTRKPFILNLAHWGDTATEMLGVTQRTRIIANLTAPPNGRFDALLFSAGGNDLAGDQFCLWLTQFVAGAVPANGIDYQRLANILGVVQAAYVDLIKIRTQIDPDCVIFLHGYDFAVPDGRPACPNIGPWLQPSLKLRGWTGAAAKAIVKEVLLALHYMLFQLERDFKNVVYVRTQGTLRQNHTDWANELHPTESGFTAIAKVFLAALAKRFPGRI